MKNRSYFRCPNALLRDDRLSYTARRVGVVLFAYSNARGECRKGYTELARLAGVSTATAVSAVRALAECGYLTVSTTKRYCKAILGVGYGRNSYALNLSTLERKQGDAMKQGYTRVRRDVLRYELTDSAFVVFLVVLSYQGQNNRMWPSIAELQKAAGTVRSTVCAGLKLLKKLPTLIVQLFQKENGAFAANSYKPAIAFAAPASNAALTATAADDGFRSLPYVHSTIKRLLTQGLKRIFSSRGVVRNLVIKIITYPTKGYTRGEKRQI